MHYVSAAFDFLENCLLEKIKYAVIESSSFCVIKNKMVNKLNKLKKLAVALKLHSYCFKFKF